MAKKRKKLNRRRRSLFVRDDFNDNNINGNGDVPWWFKILAVGFLYLFMMFSIFFLFTICS